MTDLQTLFAYRLAEAEETLSDAHTMMESDISARSIVNRTYYAMFYAVIALLLARKVEHKTSKHSGVISIFDREIVHAGLMGRNYSRMHHDPWSSRIGSFHSSPFTLAFTSWSREGMIGV